MSICVFCLSGYVCVCVCLCVYVWAWVWVFVCVGVGVCATNLGWRICGVYALSRCGTWRVFAVVVRITAHYFVPHVGFLVRTRLMCQTDRSRAAPGARGDSLTWLCERAPLWVVVRVCALLRSYLSRRVVRNTIAWTNAPAARGDYSGT